MKRFMLIGLIGMIGLGFLMGCAKMAPTGEAAITHSKTLESENVQMLYLIGQAESFLELGQYQHAQDVVQYILKDLEPDSKIAQSIATRAAIGLQRENR